MSILVPGFSERVFEFSFNAEYANRARAVLAGAPDIPTQNREKSLGYDVKFPLKGSGRAKHFVALQHKVSRFVDGRGPDNGHFLEAADGPYFAFRIDVDQFNLLERLSSAAVPGIEYHYCAPMFASRADMNANFMAKSVEKNSIWISVKDVGQISDDEPHSIIYSADGNTAHVFSKTPAPLPVIKSHARSIQREMRAAAVIEDVGALYDAVFTTISEYWPVRTDRVKADRSEDGVRRPRLRPRRSEPNAENLAQLLTDYVGVSVLVEVSE